MQLVNWLSRFDRRSPAAKRRVKARQTSWAAETLEQRQLLSGTTVDDSLGKAVADADVSLPNLYDAADHDPTLGYAGMTAGAAAAGQSWSLSAPQIVSPTGSVEAGQAVFQWTRPSNSHSFEVYVYDLDKGQAVIHWQNLTGNSYTSQEPLQAGNYRMWVRAFDWSGNYSNWSDHSDFTVTGADTRPGTPQLTGPTGTTSDTTPKITWTAAANADRYEVYLYDLAAGQLVEHKANIGRTRFVVKTPLRSGTDYRVWVRAINASGQTGQWSEHLDFRVAGRTQAVPGTPTFTGPAGATTDTTPTITWQRLDAAARYELLVYNRATGQAVVNRNDITGTSFTTGQLQGGNYVAYLRGVNSAGQTGQWAALEFGITANSQPPAAPTITGPSSTTTDTTPTITWQAVTGAARYELMVYDIAAGKQIAHNDQLTGTTATFQNPLAGGRYAVYLRAINSAGQAGQWSGHQFTVGASKPGTPTITGPSGTTDDSTPTITWQQMTGAVRYELLAYDVGAGKQVAHNDQLTGTSATFQNSLSDGDYAVYLRAINSAGQAGDWATAQFRIQTQQQTPAGKLLYVNFDGVSLSADQLWGLANGEWHLAENGNLNIDREYDGVRVQAFMAGYANREAYIQAIIDRVQEDLSPFGIRVQRITGYGAQNVGASTIMIGESNIDLLVSGQASGVAADVDFMNANWNDIGFVQESSANRYTTAPGYVNWLSDVVLHEAGHTFGLHHVHTYQNGDIQRESMGFGYTLGAEGESQNYPEHADVGFLDATFTEIYGHGFDPYTTETQNSYRTMLRNFSGTLAERRAYANSNAGAQAAAEFAETHGFHGDFPLHDHDEHDDHGADDAACENVTDTGEASVEAAVEGVALGRAARLETDAAATTSSPVLRTRGNLMTVSFRESAQSKDDGIEVAAANDDLFASLPRDAKLAASLLDSVLNA